jgi:hypothetical protein
MKTRGGAAYVRSLEMVKRMVEWQYRYRNRSCELLCATVSAVLVIGRSIFVKTDRCQNLCKICCSIRAQVVPTMPLFTF